MKEAFAAYKAWGRVDDMARWAPTDCRAPPPARAERSAADDGAHAKKLYSLFARDRDAYMALLGDAGARAARVGLAAKTTPGLQTIVKEAYVPEPVNDAGPPNADHFDPFVREGDKVFRAGAVASVFVILEQPAGTPGTDDGYVYGTLTPAGEVTSAGRVASCVNCHANAAHHRLFGPKPIRW
jgi:hypothetical protein